MRRRADVLALSLPSPNTVPETPAPPLPFKPERADASALFQGSGEMRARLRAFDWDHNPLGPVALWPQSLRLPIGLCLNSRFPMCLWWGPDLTIIYNDAYAPIFGKRHPEALGSSARLMWAEIWAAIDSDVQAVLERGESSWHERRLIRSERNGVMEDAWFTWSFSPLLGDTGAVEGVCLTTVEETAHVLREKELIATRDRLALTLSAAEIGYWSVDALTGQVTVDSNLAKAFSLPVEVATTGAPLQVFTDSIHPADRDQTVAAIADALAHRETFEAEYRLNLKPGSVRWVIARGRVTREATGQAMAMSGVLIDISERKRSEQLVAAQNQVLQLIASETSLSLILEQLVLHVEGSGEDVVASILLIDREGRLRHGAAPSLPDDFNRAVDGIQIGSNVGTCGRAAFFREVVITPDLDTDPNWALLRDRVAALGLRAAWSVPIVSVEGKVLGTFGTYFRQKREPTPEERNTVDFLSKTAALAIARYQAQEVLRESEERFRMLADNISQFAWMADRTGALFWYNQRWFDYTGTTLETMRGSGWQSVHHPDHLAAVTEKFHRQLKEGVSWEDTFPLRGANGEYRWFLSRAIPVKNHRGEVVRWFGTNTDITTLREVQEQLKESDGRFRQIADTLPQIVWGARTDGVLDYYNRRWFEFIGRPETDLEAASWEKYLHPDDLPATYETWRASLETGKTYQMEFRVRNAAGTYKWFLTRALPIHDGEGKIVRWFGTCTDIDDRKAIQEEQLQMIERERSARAASENAGRMKDDFLATLSHELRTPLNPVLLLATEAAGNPNLPAEVRADFEAIAKNVALEARLIDDLLDLTRITRGKMALSVAPADLHSVLSDAMANVAPEMQEKKIRIVTQLTPTAPVVIGDVVRLQQVFWNILRNAVKFTPSGGSITLITALTEDRKRVEVLIKDTGMGMSPEEVGRLFNAFVQGDHAGGSGSHRFGGLGLGLAISRMLVELHSGRISGSSAGAGLGSTFSVQLPLGDQSTTTPFPNGQAARSRPVARPLLRPSRILLVEDHEPTRMSLKQLLIRRHYEVVDAGSVEAALAIAASRKFDLLVTDIGLPDGDGYQLMRTLLQTHDIKGIALTGYGMESDIERSRIAGFAAHLTKPIHVQDLDAALALAAAVAQVS